MDQGGIPTPPLEEQRRTHSSKKSHSSSHKSAKSVHRTSKRTSSHSHPSPPHDSHSSADGRHKRVWKACERCRMKKTKCDGEFPCKRCKDDGLVCTAGTRKKTEFKQLPKGYAEVLEHTQFALIATVHKLYAMVRSGQSWELGEPELNDRGQPVIHDIASKLGCIRPNSDLDLPVHSIFPEDEAGLADLAAQLETYQQQQNQQQQQQQQQQLQLQLPDVDSRTERASSSELDHSDFETDYRKSVFGGNRSTTVTLSPQSLTYTDFDVQSDGFAVPSPTVAAAAAAASYPSWGPTTTSSSSTTGAARGRRPTSGSGVDMGSQQQQQQQQAFLPPSYMSVDMLQQGLLESNFGAIKPHLLSCPNPEVMMGMGDPMIYSGYDADALRM